jgi:prepilin-type N-terminal cleavage/methylation domain-containing protein
MRGFTIIEVVVAMAVVLAIAAAVFTAVQTSPDAVLVQSEMGDMQQRVRVGVDAIMRDAINATAVRPCRWGGSSADPPGTFRSDAVTFATNTGTTTYWHRIDAASDTYQLTQWSGGTSNDVPVVDHVVGLQVTYFGDDAEPLVDANLVGLRTVVVTLRVEAAADALRGPAGGLFVRPGTARAARRWAPDVEIRFRVAPRNLSLER